MKSRPLLAAALILLLCVPAKAGGGRTPDRYVIVISQVDLKRSDGTWVRAARPDKPVDLATEEARVVFYNGARRPLEGEFVNFRIFFESAVFYRESSAGSPEPAVEGWIVLGPDLAPAVYRASGISARRQDGSSLATFVLRDEDGTERPALFSLGSARDLAAPVRLVKGSAVIVRFTVDLRSALSYRTPEQLRGIPGPGRTLPSLPEVTAVTLAVDDEIRSLDAGQIRLDAVRTAPTDNLARSEMTRWP